MKSPANPTRRTLLKAGVASLAAPAILPRSALAQATQITIADVGGAPGAAIKAAFCDPFKEETGIEVVNVAHDPDPVTQFKLVVDTKSYIWDACMVTPDHVARLESAGDYLAPLDLGDAADGLLDGMATDVWAGFSVFGIVMAWRSDVYETGPKTWAEFFDVEAFPGRRGLYRGGGGMIELALLADGVAPADLYPLDLDRAFAKLDTIKDSVAVWWSSGAQNTQILQSGEVDMTDTWAGRAYAAIDSGAPVEVTWNGLYSVDGWSIPKGTPHLEETQEFIRFCMRPDRQGAYSSMVANGPSHSKAFDYMDEARAHTMPTYPDNIANMRMLDSAWWSANNDEVTQRLQEWLLL